MRRWMAVETRIGGSGVCEILDVGEAAAEAGRRARWIWRGDVARAAQDGGRARATSKAHRLVSTLVEKMVQLDSAMSGVSARPQEAHNQGRTLHFDVSRSQ